MNFEDFVKKVKDSIREFLPSEYKNARIWIDNYQKLNEQYTSLMISKEGETVVPAINLDRLYERYSQDPEHGLSGLLEDAASIFQMERPDYGATRLFDYEQIKSSLFFRVSSAERNKEILETIPHELQEDIALTVHIMIEDGNEGLASSAVTNQLLEMYGISSEQLFQDARISSPAVLPVMVEKMDDIMRDMMVTEMKAAGMSEQEIEEAVKEMEAVEKPLMIVVSNEMKTDGASALFYPGILDQIGERIGGDFLILPSSIHETIIVPDDGSTDLEELKKMVKEINEEQVAPKDRLTDEVYHYDTKERVFEKASEFEARKNTKELGKESTEKDVQITGGKPKHKSAEMSL